MSSSAANPQHEPTMEEILASIRKIISEDSSEAEARGASPEPHAPEGEVLELTRDDVVDEPARTYSEPATEQPPEPVRVMQMPASAEVEDDVEFQMIEEHPV